MRGVLFVAVSLIGGLALAAAPALAGNGAQTETIHFTDEDSFVVGPDDVACGVGIGSVITVQFKGVVHRSVRLSRSHCS